MDRAFNSEEKEKVRAARADFFKILKRKDSSSQSTQPASSTAKSISTSSNKRSKVSNMGASNPAGLASNTPLIIRFYDQDTQAKDAHGRTLEEILSWDDSKLERCHNYIQILFPLPEGSPFNLEAPVIDREVMLAFRSRSELHKRLRKSFLRMLDFYGFQVIIKPEEEEKKEEGKDKKGKGKADAANNEQASESAELATPATDSEAAVVTDTANTTKAHDAPATTPNLQPHYTSITGYHIVQGPDWRKKSRNWVVRFDHNHLRITRILRCLRVLGLQAECDAFFAALKHVFEDQASRISDTSMMYWQRAVTRPLYIAPDDDRCDWLKNWEEAAAREKDWRGE